MVYKGMSIQTKEEHIGHVKQSKSDRFRDRYCFVVVVFLCVFFFQAKHGGKSILPKSENLTVTMVFIKSYVLSSACIFCLNKTNNQKKSFESL